MDSEEGNKKNKDKAKTPPRIIAGGGEIVYGVRGTSGVPDVERDWSLLYDDDGRTAHTYNIDGTHQSIKDVDKPWTKRLRIRPDYKIETEKGNFKVEVNKDDSLLLSPLKTEKRNRDGTITQRTETRKDRNKAIGKKAIAKGYAGGLRVADKLIKRNFPDAVSEKAVGVRAANADAEVHAADLLGLQVAGASAGASAGVATAGTSVTPLGASASAEAYGAKAEAKAVLLEDFIEASATAVAAEAKASAGAGLAQLGAHAGASATVGRVEAGISNTPLNAHAEGPGADAEAGVSWGYTGATVGAYAGEVKAGPFAARAGVKFGAGIRNGVPELDLGPVTVPCVVM